MQKGHLSIVEYLVSKGADVKEKYNSIFNTPLSFAVKSGCADVVSYLVKQGVEINDDVPLNLAVEKNYLDILKLLIFQGSEKDIEEKFHKTLTYAIEKNNYWIVKSLLDLNFAIDINKKDCNRKTLLTYASVTKNCHSIAELLIKKGADVNAQDRLYEITPLMFAVACGNLETVELLVEHGANVNAKDGFGHNSMSIAKVSGHVTIKEYLKNTGKIEQQQENDDCINLHIYM